MTRRHQERASTLNATLRAHPAAKATKVDQSKPRSTRNKAQAALQAASAGSGQDHRTAMVFEPLGLSGWLRG